MTKYASLTFDKDGASHKLNLYKDLQQAIEDYNHNKEHHPEYITCVMLATYNTVKQTYMPIEIHKC